MDQKMLNHLRHLHAVGNFQYQHLLDVENLGGRQNLAEQNLDVDLTCPDAAHLSHQLDVQEAAELRHQLRMDYFQGAVDVELRFLMRMDYFLDEVQALRASAQPMHQLLELPHLFQQPLVAQYCFRRLRALGQPLAQLNQRRVRPLIQQLTLDLLHLF